jgi:galactokinase
MIAAFRRVFGEAAEVRVFRAPGRVNLIGEHTDYNLGFVLPMALQLAAYVAIAPSGDDTMRVHSASRGETREFSISTVADLLPAHDWTDYVIGVAQGVIRAGYPLQGANLLIHSTVPEGSGLSSSAALEVSSALALLSGRSIDPLQLTRLCQSAERNFVGVPSGIMDQYVSVFGREHAALEIDCRALQHRAVSLPDSVAFVAVNSMVRHELSGSAYRDRVAECAAAAHAMGVASLRDATLEDLDRHATEMFPVVWRRARHVISENRRVTRFVDAGARCDAVAMGSLMLESHRSLRDDYEVSCAELDFLVDSALTVEGVYGSRMTGGGFGGCTVTMLRPDAEPAFRSAMAEAYKDRFGIEPPMYDCIPSEGAGEVKNLETIPPMA